jgi:shikimate dehydrogenase
LRCNDSYKQAVLPFYKLSKKAALIGAVNTIKITKKEKLKGYNTVTTVSRKH